MGNKSSSSSKAVTTPIAFDADALAQQIASQLLSLLKSKKQATLVLFASALEFVEAIPQATGAQKKLVLIAAFAALAALVEKSNAALSSTVHNVGAVAESILDVVVALTKTKPKTNTNTNTNTSTKLSAAAGAGVRLEANASANAGTTTVSLSDGPDITALFVLGTKIIAQAQAARTSAGGTLTPDAILALVPAIVSALSAVQLFVGASVDQQIEVARHVLLTVQEAAPANEQPAWAAVAVGLAPTLYAIDAARKHTLNVNSIISAIAANPEQVVACCVGCFSLAASVASAISKSKTEPPAPAPAPAPAPPAPSAPAPIVPLQATGRRVIMGAAGRR